MLQHGKFYTTAPASEQWPPPYPEQLLTDNSDYNEYKENEAFDFSLVAATASMPKIARAGSKAANAAWWSTLLAGLTGVFLLLMLLVVVAAIFLRGESPNLTIIPAQAVASGEQPTKLGQKTARGVYTFSVNRVETSNSFQSVYQSSAGKRLVAIEVSIQSRAAVGVMANQSWFSLQDELGNNYGISLFGKEPGLPTVNDIPKGEAVTGWVTFEVPATARNLTLQYRPFNQESIGFSVRL